MRILMVAMATAGVLLAAAPASAQSSSSGLIVTIETSGPPPVEPVQRTRGNRAAMESFARADCRMINVRSQMPDGSLVTRRLYKCD